MPEIPTLLEHLARHEAQPWCGGVYCSCPDDRDFGTEQDHRVHVTKVYREARTIWQRADLAALPVGAIALDADEHLIHQTAIGPYVDAASDHIEWPAEVLRTPRDGASDD